MKKEVSTKPQEQEQKLKQEELEKAKEQKEAEKIALEGKSLYEKGEITGEDLHKILLAVGNLFEYLNDKYGEDEKLVKEVFQVTKTLYDPVVAEKAKKEEKKELAKKLLIKGMSVTEVIDITGLSKDEIKELQNE